MTPAPVITLFLTLCPGVVAVTLMAFLSEPVTVSSRLCVIPLVIVPCVAVVIAARVAAEFRDGDVVNLGMGMPTLASAFVPPELTVFFHAEHGLIGIGPHATEEQIDPECINASREPVTLIPGASVVKHSDSFAIIRGGHLDVSVLGAYQVSAKGDLEGLAKDVAVGAKDVKITLDSVRQ